MYGEVSTAQFAHSEDAALSINPQNRVISDESEACGCDLEKEGSTLCFDWVLQRVYADTLTICATDFHLGLLCCFIKVH